MRLLALSLLATGSSACFWGTATRTSSHIDSSVPMLSEIDDAAVKKSAGKGAIKAKSLLKSKATHSLKLARVKTDFQAQSVKIGDISEAVVETQIDKDTGLKKQFYDICHDKCDAAHMHCRLNHDLPEQYSCVCDRGYFMTADKVCVPNKCFGKCGGFMQQCIEDSTTKGLTSGYKCICQPGYKWKNDKHTACVVDPVCAGKCTGRSEICLETPGTKPGYRCQCDSGYIWETKEELNCVRHPKCVGQCDRGNMVCVVSDTVKEGFYCKCWAGFKWVDDNQYRCRGDPCYQKCAGLKHRNQVCVEDQTSPTKYQCQCNDGFHWHEAGHCVESVKCKSGEVSIGNKCYNDYRCKESSLEKTPCFGKAVCDSPLVFKDSYRGNDEFTLCEELKRVGLNGEMKAACKMSVGTWFERSLHEQCPAGERQAAKEMSLVKLTNSEGFKLSHAVARVCPKTCADDVCAENKCLGVVCTRAKVCNVDGKCVEPNKCSGEVVDPCKDKCTGSHQKCEVVGKGHTCTCAKGYEWSSKSSQCNVVCSADEFELDDDCYSKKACVDILEEGDKACDPCESQCTGANMKCDVVDGNYKCSCKTGFAWTDNSKTACKQHVVCSHDEFELDGDCFSKKTCQDALDVIDTDCADGVASLI